ncbi:MAG TPA: hypothetical protein VFJ60_03490 [Gaiella sp.]|nr:hypothetical protein [Gaiella sp.]
MRTHLRRLVPLGVLAAAAAFAAAMLVGTGPGAAATQARPVNQTPPTISGTAQVGSTLTARDGQWTGNPTGFDYSWRRCDTDGGSCSNISGATDKTYVLKQVDQGNTIRLRVTARNADGRTAATSVPTAVVQAAAPPTSNPCDKNPPVASELKPPERLLIAGQQVSPGVIGGSTQTIVARFRVTACDGKPVQGALVYVTAVPYNMFSVPPEATTGADGWAELRMNRERGFPASPKQQLLVMFVRARGPGGNLLGGISTRRLVSFPVDLRR